MKAAKKVYPEFRCAMPSLEAVVQAFSQPKQQEEIAKRLQPTLCFMEVKEGEVAHLRPVIVDGIAEMPLEQDASEKSRGQRILAMRKLREESPNPYLKELGDDELYDLLGLATEAEGSPIDQQYWTMLSAGYKKGDSFVRCAYRCGGRSNRGEDFAGDVFGGDRLRSAVWGDVIS